MQYDFNNKSITPRLSWGNDNSPIKQYNSYRLNYVWKMHILYLFSVACTIVCRLMPKLHCECLQWLWKTHKAKARDVNDTILHDKENWDLHDFECTLKDLLHISYELNRYSFPKAALSTLLLVLVNLLIWQQWLFFLILAHACRNMPLPDSFCSVPHLFFCF